MSKNTLTIRNEYRRDHVVSDRSALHTHRVKDLAERALADPADLSFDEIRELGMAVMSHLRTDPRF